jgi:hypothetical protein
VGRTYDASVRAGLAALERNILPDAVVRRLTKTLLASRLRLGYLPSADLQLSHLLHFVHCTVFSIDLFLYSYPVLAWIYRLLVCCLICPAALEEMPIAVETDKAKEQHYELPTSFFKLVLGENLKYRY